MGRSRWQVGAAGCVPRAAWLSRLSQTTAQLHSYTQRCVEALQCCRRWGGSTAARSPAWRAVQEAQELRHCVRSSWVAREMLLALATKRLRRMAHVGLTERLDESVVSMAADLGGWGRVPGAGRGAGLPWHWATQRRPWRWLGKSRGHREAGHAHTTGSVGRELRNWTRLCFACSHSTPCLAPALCGAGAGLNFSGPAYKYTSASAFSYDGGEVNQDGALLPGLPHSGLLAPAGCPATLVGLSPYAPAKQPCVAWAAKP